MSYLLIAKKFLKFLGRKTWYFCSQKVDEKIVFTDYSKVLVSNFSVMENMVFFEPRGWWKRWYLLIIENFLLWTFLWWEIRSFFLSQEVDGKMIFTGYREVLVLNLSVIGNTIFFSAKKLVERWYLLGLLELSMIFEDLGNTVFRAVL